jgi:hypothetical protein
VAIRRSTTLALALGSAIELCSTGSKRLQRESNTGVSRILDLVAGDVDREFEGASLQKFSLLYRRRQLQHVCLHPCQRIGVARIASAANQHYPVADDSAKRDFAPRHKQHALDLFEWTLVLSVDLYLSAFCNHCLPACHLTAFHHRFHAQDRDPSVLIDLMLYYLLVVLKGATRSSFPDQKTS